MKKTNTNKDSKMKKFLKLLNPRTLLGQGIILGTIAVLALLIWFFTVTAMSVDAYINTTADKKAFSDSTGQALTNINNAEIIDNEDFNDFNIKFTCTNYNADGNSASFRLYYYVKENGITLASTISTKLLLTADYIDYNSYSSTYTVSKLAGTLTEAEGSSTYYKTYTISSLASFPTNATTTVWPYTLTQITAPIAYLYLNYSYKDGTKTVTKTQLIRYDYSEFNVLQGGLKA